MNHRVIMIVLIALGILCIGSGLAFTFLSSEPATVANTCGGLNGQCTQRSGVTGYTVACTGSHPSCNCDFKSCEGKACEKGVCKTSAPKPNSSHFDQNPLPKVTPKVNPSPKPPTPVAKPQCSNGKDDDSDGKLDLADPGCDDLYDTTEDPDPEGSVIPCQIAGGVCIGACTFAADDCVGTYNLDTGTQQCSCIAGGSALNTTIINAEDHVIYCQLFESTTCIGKCYSATEPKYDYYTCDSSLSESGATQCGCNAPECVDGIDNDEDGATDYPDDPDCSSYADDSETYEDICTVLTGDACTGSCLTSAHYTGTCSGSPCACVANVDDLPDNLDPCVYDVEDGICNGADNCPEKYCAYKEGVNNLCQCAEMPGGDGPTDPQCSDGADNDGDDYIDYLDDPGCESADDTTEANAEQICTDSEPGSDPDQIGVCQDNEGTDLDICDPAGLIEYSCSAAGKCVQNAPIACPAGTTCEDGACVVPSACIDDETDPDIFSTGNCNDILGAHPDVCEPDGSVSQYSCSATGTCEGTVGHCPIGNNCAEGSCEPLPLPDCTDASGAEYYLMLDEIVLVNSHELTLENVLSEITVGVSLDHGSEEHIGVGETLPLGSGITVEVLTIIYNAANPSESAAQLRVRCALVVNECNDGLDNDEHGDIDAADPNCADGSTSESFVACTDSGGIYDPGYCSSTGWGDACEGTTRIQEATCNAAGDNCDMILTPCGAGETCMQDANGYAYCATEQVAECAAIYREYDIPGLGLYSFFAGCDGYCAMQTCTVVGVDALFNPICTSQAQCSQPAN